MDKPLLTLNYSGFRQSISPFPLRVYMGEKIPSSNFNTVSLSLSLTSLKWKEVEKYAHELVQKGFFLIWDLDFNLTSSLSDEAQYLALEIGFEHFKNTLYATFETNTLGVILYKGPLDFSTFPWTLEEEEKYLAWLENREAAPFQRRLFQRDYSLDFLKILSSLLPLHIPPFLLFDDEGVMNREENLYLLSEMCFETFLVGSKTNPFPYALPLFGWELGNSPLGYFSNDSLGTVEEKAISSAIALPPSHTIDELFLEKMRNVIERHSGPFRLIPESQLTEQWQGVETLIVFPDKITPQGKRKILGFCAAGGTVLESF
jgi:hypothetical protein